MWELALGFIQNNLELIITALTVGLPSGGIALKYARRAALFGKIVSQAVTVLEKHPDINERTFYADARKQGEAEDLLLALAGGVRKIKGLSTFEAEKLRF